VQFHFVPGRYLVEGLVPGDGHGFSLGACVLKPRSRGYVALGSPDPTAKPLIVHNYLEHDDDVASIVAGVRMAVEICATEPLAGLVSETIEGPDSDSDDDVLAYVRGKMITIYHPVGTCRMGDDDGAVVDRELRVRGVEGLRVVDASVMPEVPRGNTNAPTIALAERASDLIRGRAPHATAQAAPEAATPA
jgi:choline dehydrogenase